MSLLQTFATQLTTFQIVVGVVISIVIANIWQKVFDNFFYHTLGLDEDSAYVALIIAIGVTAFFFIFLSFITSFAREIVLGGVDESGLITDQLTGGSTGSSGINLLPRCEGACDSEKTSETSTTFNHSSSRSKNKPRRRLRTNTITL